MFKKIQFLIPMMLMALLVFSCDSDNAEEGPETDSFDRGAMLANWADNIIIPSFENFAEETQQLNATATAFSEAPSEATLAELRTAYEEAYLAYQTVAPYEVGKAEAISYHNFLNIYPTKVQEIENKIEDGNYNLELPSSFDEQGFPAVDYLLNGLAETDAEIVEFYTTNPQAANYRKYLTDVTTRIDTLTDVVLEDWQNSFRDIFVANTSSSSTGSVDKFTNDFIMYFEMDLRSGKIGYPSGALTGDPAPQTAEALYSDGLSKQLYLKALENVQNFFNGRYFDGSGTGPSYKQYLDYLYEIRGGEKLSDEINANFDAAEEQAASLNADLAEQVRQDNSLMLIARDLLQKNVVLMKVDMLQALDISVDYVDTDGD